MSKSIVADVVSESPNRRSFVRKLGIASAAVGAASIIKPSKVEAQSGIYDAAILNFALNLEFLEAEFYTVATTGMTIDNFGSNITGSGTAGATTGGSQVTFTSSQVQAVAEELADDERTHVALLQSAILSLGSDAPIAKPPINLNALGFGFGSQNDFLKLAQVFEDIGVTAYGGAAPLISSKTVLGYAARILAVEALHAGNIRLLIAQNNIATTALDGADILPPPSGTLYFSTDAMALSEVRTPGQVLYLAYDAPSAAGGGFFPSGVNGNPALTTSAATPAGNDSATLTANPNPISLNGATYGATTISWTAPSSVQYVEVRIGSPSGPLFATGTNTGSAPTGQWVSNGLMFFLQDVTGGKALNSIDTLAILIVHAM